MNLFCLCNVATLTQRCGSHFTLDKEGERNNNTMKEKLNSGSEYKYECNERGRKHFKTRKPHK